MPTSYSFKVRIFAAVAAALFIVPGARPAEAAVLYKQDPKPFQEHIRTAGTSFVFDFGIADKAFDLGTFVFVFSATTSQTVIVDVRINGAATGTSHGIFVTGNSNLWNQMQFDFASDSLRVLPGNHLEIITYAPAFVAGNLIGSYTRPTTTNPVVEVASGFYPSVLLSNTNRDTTYFDTGAFSPGGVAPECGITDVSACITNAFAWLFVPPEDVVQEWGNISLASTSPFGYMYAAPGIINDLWNGTTTPFVFQVDTSDIQSSMRNIAIQAGASATDTTGIIAGTSTPITVFDSCWADTVYVGHTFFATYVMPFETAALWFGFLVELIGLAFLIF